MSIVSFQCWWMAEIFQKLDTTSMTWNEIKLNRIFWFSLLNFNNSLCCAPFSLQLQYITHSANYPKLFFDNCGVNAVIKKLNTIMYYFINEIMCLWLHNIFLLVKIIKVRWLYFTPHNFTFICGRDELFLSEGINSV